MLSLVLHISAATEKGKLNMENDATVGWIAAIVIGGIAGWLAEQFMKSNMGILMNIILGIVGAIVASAILTSSALPRRMARPI